MEVVLRRGVLPAGAREAFSRALADVAQMALSLSQARAKAEMARLLATISSESSESAEFERLLGLAYESHPATQRALAEMDMDDALEVLETYQTWARRDGKPQT